MKKAKIFADKNMQIGKVESKMFGSLLSIWEERYMKAFMSQTIPPPMKTDSERM